jgi:hypothetical protein
MLGTGTGAWVSHPSIDAIINKEVPQPTEIPVLNLDAMSQDPGNLRGNTTYDLECRPVHGEMDPSRTFDRLFTNGSSPRPPPVAPVTPGGRKAARPAQERAGRRAFRAAGACRAASAGRIARRWSTTSSSSARPSAACRCRWRRAARWRATGRPPGTQVPKLEYTFKFQDNYPKIVQLQFDMAVAALATDKSRLVTCS